MKESRSDLEVNEKIASPFEAREMNFPEVGEAIRMLKEKGATAGVVNFGREYKLLFTLDDLLKNPTGDTISAQNIVDSLFPNQMMDKNYCVAIRDGKVVTLSGNLKEIQREKREKIGFNVSGRDRIMEEFGGEDKIIASFLEALGGKKDEIREFMDRRRNYFKQFKVPSK